MILDLARMAVIHEGQEWPPTAQQMRLVIGMSAEIGRYWTRRTLLGMMSSSAGLPVSVNTQIKNIRLAFRERTWPDPIKTRNKFGYAWQVPLEVKGPALGDADEFRFRSIPT